MGASGRILCQSDSAQLAGAMHSLVSKSSGYSWSSGGSGVHGYMGRNTLIRLFCAVICGIAGGNVFGGGTVGALGVGLVVDIGASAV